MESGIGSMIAPQLCPRRFQFLREYNFKPSHSVEAFFGQLVHQTIERVHRSILDRADDLETLLPEQRLHDFFEERKENALMVVPYRHESVQQASLDFDEIVSFIQQKQFQVKIPPEPMICRGCDIRHLCMKEGVIQSVYS